MDPFTMMLLGGLGGGLLNTIFGGGGGYEQIGSAADVTDVNPYSGLLMGGLGQYDYTAPFSAFAQQIAPQLQGLSISGPFAESQFGLAQQRANQIRRNLGETYSQGGALFSGAFGEALGAGVAQPYMEAITNITGQQTGLLGQLYGGALGGLPGLYQMPYQGAMPSLYEPSYGYQPSGFERFMGGFGMGTGIGGAFGSVPGSGGGGGLGYSPMGQTGGRNLYWNP